MYRKHGLKRIGGTDRQKLIAKLDITLGKSIKQQYDTCITCPRKRTDGDDPRGWHIGHFRPRSFMATRFDPKNVALQCAHDNIYQEGESYEFGLAIDERYGEGIAVALYKKSKEIRQWTEKELEQLISAAKMGYSAYAQLYEELAA